MSCTFLFATVWSFVSDCLFLLSIKELSFIIYLIPDIIVKELSELELWERTPPY